MRKLLAIMIVALTTASPALARKSVHHHHHKLRASKPQPVATTDHGGAQRHPDDIALDRKIGSICRGC